MEVYGPTLEGQRKLVNNIEMILNNNSGVTDIDNYVGVQEKLYSLNINNQK